MKGRGNPSSWQAVMVVLNLALLVLLAALAAHSGNPQQTQDQWVIADDRLQYDFKYPDGQEEEGNMGPVSSAEEVGSAEEVQILQTTPETRVLDVEEPNKPKDSSLWKITLVVAVLLVSAAGLLSIAYYMCVWRGGRIHYNLHKGGYA